MAAGPASERDRKAGAILGQLVGDAAALGTHWIYDQAELARRYPEIRGFEAPAPGHYHSGKRPGEQTHYGDGARLMLASVAARGRFDRDDFGRRFVDLFRGYRGYKDHATKGTLANVEAGLGFDRSGADDDQLATPSRLAPLVVAHQDDPRLLDRVDEATRVAQMNDRAVAYGRAVATILAELLRGRDVEAALDAVPGTPGVSDEVRELLALARRLGAGDTVESTLLFGQSCPLPRSFPSAVQALLRHRGSFEEAILATLRAGGDSAGRAAVLGAWLGAALGRDAIPDAWVRRLAAGDEIRADVERLLGP